MEAMCYYAIIFIIIRILSLYDLTFIEFEMRSLRFLGFFNDIIQVTQ